jgi:hypothetical protein
MCRPSGLPARRPEGLHYERVLHNHDANAMLLLPGEQLCKKGPANV